MAFFLNLLIENVFLKNFYVTSEHQYNKNNRYNFLTYLRYPNKSRQQGFDCIHKKEVIWKTTGERIIHKKILLFGRKI